MMHSKQFWGKKKSGKLLKMRILLHDNSDPNTTNLLTATLATMGWEIVSNRPYSHDLAPSDFHLFGPMKVDPGVQNFELMVNSNAMYVLNWLHS
jgi:hypothetical protein